MFRDRHDAALQLANRLRKKPLRKPLVLAIPRGGVAIGAKLAEELGAELDVVLSRKLRAPNQPELAIGAVSEAGQDFVNDAMVRATNASPSYLAEEKTLQLSEIARRKSAFREIRPAAPLQGRSVIVTDDGIATGATMLAALQSIRLHDPFELILAIPVAPVDRLMPLRAWCDDVICLETPADFRSVGQYYKRFGQLGDEEVVALLRESMDRVHPQPPAIGLPSTTGKSTQQ